MREDACTAESRWDEWCYGDTARALLRLLNEREKNCLRQGFILGVLSTSQDNPKAETPAA